MQRKDMELAIKQARGEIQSNAFRALSDVSEISNAVRGMNENGKRVVHPSIIQAAVDRYAELYNESKAVERVERILFNNLEVVE